MRPLAVLVAALTFAAVALLACRPPAADGGPTTLPTTTTSTVPLAPLPDTVTVGSHGIRGEQIQLTEPPAPPTTTVPLPPHYNIWLMLALCESGGDWYINTSNGYFGGLQFNAQTWRVAGGLQYGPRADLATVLQQMWTAEQVLVLRAGWGMNPWAAWPACSRRLGLR